MTGGLRNTAAFIVLGAAAVDIFVGADSVDLMIGLRMYPNIHRVEDQVGS